MILLILNWKSHLMEVDVGIGMRPLVVSKQGAAWQNHNSLSLSNLPVDNKRSCDKPRLMYWKDETKSQTNEFYSLVEIHRKHLAFISKDIDTQKKIHQTHRWGQYVSPMECNHCGGMYAHVRYKPTETYIQ